MTPTEFAQLTGSIWGVGVGIIIGLLIGLIVRFQKR